MAKAIHTTIATLRLLFDRKFSVTITPIMVKGDEA